MYYTFPFQTLFGVGIVITLVKDYIYINENQMIIV